MFKVEQTKPCSISPSPKVYSMSKFLIKFAHCFEIRSSGHWQVCHLFHVCSDTQFSACPMRLCTPMFLVFKLASLSLTLGATSSNRYLYFSSSDSGLVCICNVNIFSNLIQSTEVPLKGVIFSSGSFVGQLLRPFPSQFSFPLSFFIKILSLVAGSCI